jgi:CelD/BcsL family acetyltransferase involved in cellulose biosynthesis
MNTLSTNTVTVDPTTDPLWQELVTRQNSSVFHSPAWARVLAETYGWEPRAQVLVDGEGEPRAGIPFCRISDMISERIVSLPFSDYCDPLVGNDDEWNRLVEGLLDEGLPIAGRCLHNNVPLGDERFAVVKQAKWHGVDLQPDLDAIWGRIHESARRAIRKAQKEGVEVRIAQGQEELRAFFEMHLRIRKYKYRLIAQPYSFFENIWRQFMEEQGGALMLAYHGDTVIGGTLYLEWKDTLYYKFNASARADLPYRPNDLLTWEGIKYGKAKGYSNFDFGLSDWDEEGLLRYKRKFATEEKAISFLRFTPDGPPGQQEQQARGLLNQLTDLFVDESVPDNISAKAGEILYRFFT